LSRIFLSPPHVGDDERRMLMEAFDSNWIAPVGPDLDAFEREMADVTGTRHAVGLASGTAGLHLGLLMLGVGPTDDVIVPSLTFAATANAVAYLGARPVFVDCSPDTWTLDPDLLEEELKERAQVGRLPKVVVTVDLYGQCADYDRITAACDNYGIPLLADAAEALGASYRGRPAGSFGAMAVFSFNGNKIITTSGGGMLVSDDNAFVSKARFLSTQARDPAPHYQHTEIGYNYRLSNLLAALGRAQLRNLGDRVQRRRKINSRYRSALAELPGIAFMPLADYGEPTCWLTCVTVDPAIFGATREDIRVHLETLDVESRPTWKPLHLQPVFSTCPVVGGATSAGIFELGLCLPSGSSLTEADLERVVAGILACRP
jgi:dTDP-4-amino-4,6-dideoxygalactose transaminase